MGIWKKKTPMCINGLLIIYPFWQNLKRILRLLELFCLSKGDHHRMATTVRWEGKYLILENLNSINQHTNFPLHRLNGTPENSGKLFYYTHRNYAGATPVTRTTRIIIIHKR